MTDKIIQIMPAPKNLFAIYKNDNQEIESPIICLALTSDGNVLSMDMGTDGWIDDAASPSNFLRIERRGNDGP